MWPDEINPKDGTIYMEIGGHKVKLSQKGSVRLEINKKSKRNSAFRLTAWRDKIWTVWERDTGLKHFCNRNSAIMWLKRYGKPETFYMLENRARFGDSARVENGYVYFCNTENGYVYFCNTENGLWAIAESKYTCDFATRNN